LTLLRDASLEAAVPSTAFFDPASSPPFSAALLLAEASGSSASRVSNRDSKPDTAPDSREPHLEPGLGFWGEAMPASDIQRKQ